MKDTKELKIMTDLPKGWMECNGNIINDSDSPLNVVATLDFTLTKHEYMCKMTETVALKSTCPRKHVGAIFVNQDYEILATGYNSSPKGFPNCKDIGCLIENGGCIRTAHAEMNAILQAAKRGTPLKNAILYLTITPCVYCAKHLINLEITEIRCKEEYRDKRGIEWLKTAKIKVSQW